MTDSHQKDRQAAKSKTACRSSWQKAALLLCLALMADLPAGAQDQGSVPAQPQTRILYEDLLLDFTPERGYFFVEVPGAAALRVDAVITAPPERTASAERRSTSPGPQRWLAGAAIQVPDASDLNYSLLLSGGGKFQLLPHAVAPAGDQYAGATSEKLRERLLEKRGVLKSWEMQLKEQADSLERLRADADVIANLGRIVDVKEEIERQNQVIRDLEKDTENLRQFLKLVKADDSPRNFAGRETQLTRQIAELAEAARAAEAGERVRRSHSEEELRQKLAIVEASRTEDYDGLQRELIKLRKQRVELEGSLKRREAGDERT